MVGVWASIIAELAVAFALTSGALSVPFLVLQGFDVNIIAGWVIIILVTINAFQMFTRGRIL